MTTKHFLRRQIRKSFDIYQEKKRYYTGVLGDASGVVRAPTDHFVYVRLRNGEVITAFNDRVPTTSGRPVIVSFYQGRYLVEDTWQVYDAPLWSGVSEHAETHDAYGNDPVYLRGEQFLPGLVIPIAGGLTVKVFNPVTGLYETVNLTASRPSSGAQWCLISCAQDGTLSVTTGGAAGSYDELDIDEIPTTTDVSLAAIKMFSDQTEIVRSKLVSDVLDLRFSRKGLVTWGIISGDLEDQADLKAALDGKAPVEIVESGFPSRTTTTYEFNSTSPRLFRLYAASGSYEVWINHTKRTISTTKDVTISDVTGLHYIYFDDDEALHEQVGFTETLILDKTLVYIISWNATDSVSLIEGDERHGLMQAVVHSYLHRVLHAQWIEGGAITATADGSGDLAAHAQIAISNGRFLDEDINHIIQDGLYQELSPTAQIPIYYRSGASDWKMLAATGYIVTTTGSGRAAYNLLSGGSWSLAEVTNNNYVLMHIIWTNDYRHNTMAVVGQAQYATLALARAGATTELTSLALGGFDDLGPEWVPLGTLIIQTSNGYANAVKSRVRTTDTGGSYIDWRETKFAGGSGGGIDDAPSDGVPYVRKDAGWVGLGQVINAATSKATPVDADELGLWDSVASAFKKLTWANLKATLLTTWKDATGGLVGLTLFKINFKNAANTVTSFLTNSNTAERTYTFQDRDGTIADNTDLALKAPLASPTLTGTPAAPTASQGTNTTQLATTAFVQAEKPVIESNTNDIFRVDSPGGNSTWTGTITNISADRLSVTVSAPVTGTEAVLVPTSTSQLAKMRLYNLTNPSSALILNYNTGTNVITLTAAAPASWANTNSLTIASQTVTGSGQPMIDLEITSGPTGKNALWLGMVFTGGAAGDRLTLHPFEAFGASKYKNLFCQVAAVLNEGARPLKMTNNVFSMFWTGTPSVVILREDGYLP